MSKETQTTDKAHNGNDFIADVVPRTFLEAMSLYLPYELKCNVDGQIVRLDAIYADGTYVFHDLVESENGFNSVKPILKPMEYLNDSYVSELAQMVVDFDSNYDLGYATKLIVQYKTKPTKMPYILFKKLIEWHFDVFGLIERGLSVSV